MQQRKLSGFNHMPIQHRQQSSTCFDAVIAKDSRWHIQLAQAVLTWTPEIGPGSTSGGLPCRLRGQLDRAVIGPFTTRSRRRSLRPWRFSHASSQPWLCTDPLFVPHQR